MPVPAHARYLADLLIAALRHAARDLAERPLCDEDRAEAAELLLPPMVLGNEVPAASQCFLQVCGEGEGTSDTA